MAEQIKMLFGVNTSGGPWNTVLKEHPNLPTERERGPAFNFGNPSIFKMAEARDFKFCTCIGSGDNKKNYATVGHTRIHVWVV